MGFWSSVKKQFLDVIEWTESSDDVLAYRFPIADNEIQNGAQLTVRESQAALFVDEGKPADQFKAGRHKLTTQNLPVLTTLKSWPYTFNSPFKSEVYFFSLRQKLGQKWGTPQPITIRDKEFGSVQVRMFGIFSYHISDIATFYTQVSGTRELYRTDELGGQLVGHIAGAAAAVFGQSNIPFLDMAANQLALGDALKQQLDPAMAKLGVALDAFVVESVSLPEELQKALSDKQSMGILGNMGTYAQYQTAKSIPDAAKNPSGLAGLGAGLAAGVGFGQMMGNAMGSMGMGGQQQASSSGQGAPAVSATLVPCFSCKNPIEPEAAFCKHCGKAQRSICPNCQATWGPEAAFCAKCGGKLGG
jgi:membrane protease subunit (stomatin/prohibitin family)